MTHFQGDVVFYLFTIYCGQRCMICANLNVKNMLYGTHVQLIKMRINIWRSDWRVMIKFISVKHDLVSTKHLSKSKKTGSNLCGLP